MIKAPLYLALIHFPVYNKFGDVITTSITNLDLHDISRTCLTFGIKKFFVVTPISSQKDMITRIINFWKRDVAKNFNACRYQALELVHHTPDLSEAIQFIKIQEGCDPVVAGTTAVQKNNQISYSDFRDSYIIADKPVILLFGTGNGLAQEILSECDCILKPVQGVGSYNHLSVRSAAAVIMDRLTSEKYRR